MSHKSPNPQDIASLMYPTAHRMPTVSAAQALENLKNPRTQRISTGLPSLDYQLHIPSSQLPDVTVQPRVGGISKGQVTEIYGPPGIGKTAFGIQLASNTLQDGTGVVWIDCAHALPGPRLRAVLEFVQNGSDASQSSVLSESPTVNDAIQKFHHFTTPTIAHIVALLCHTRPSFPPQNTSLMVIDMLSLLIECAFPKTSTSASVTGNAGKRSNNDLQAWSASRKWSVLQSIMSSLQKLATLHNIAIVLLNHSVTHVTPGSRAVLAPALGSRAWVVGISNLILLVRGFNLALDGVRFAFIMRVGGVAKVANSDNLPDMRPVAFKIEQYGLEEVALLATQIPNPAAQNLIGASRKRKADEIRDSEEEDDAETTEDEYGWAAQDDGELPRPPPQWQGSEDILVPGDGDTADDEDHEHEHELEE